jgi:hypothetical protein
MKWCLHIWYPAPPWARVLGLVLWYIRSNIHGHGCRTIVRCTALILPFPFYYTLWNYPQWWVGLCGRGVDPCHRMAQVSHLLKAIQILSLLSVATFSWPPWYCVLLFAAGQYLNFKWAWFLPTLSFFLRFSIFYVCMCLSKKSLLL